MSKKNRIQHYIPQFYLRFFSVNKKSIGTYIKDKDLIVENAKIKKVAQVPYLYSVNEKDLWLEHILGKAEHTFANIYKNIMTTKHIPRTHTQVYNSFLWSIAIQKERTAFVADDANKSFRNIAKTEIKLKSKKDNQLKRIELPLLKAVNFSELNVPNWIPIKFSIKETEFLFDLNATLFVIRDNINLEYVTSDVPVITYNYLARFLHYSGNASTLLHRGIIVLLPLSPKFFLMLYDGRCYHFSSIIYLSSVKDVKHLNELVIRNSYHQIFFSQSMPVWQRNSIIKLLRKVQTRNLVTFSNYKKMSNKKEFVKVKNDDNIDKIDLIGFKSYYINKLISIPKIRLTNFARRIIVPKHQGWLYRVENPSILKAQKEIFKSKDYLI